MFACLALVQFHSNFLVNGAGRLRLSGTHLAPAPMHSRRAPSRGSAALLLLRQPSYCCPVSSAHCALSPLFAHTPHTGPASPAAPTLHSPGRALRSPPNGNRNSQVSQRRPFSRSRRDVTSRPGDVILCQPRRRTAAQARYQPALVWGCNAPSRIFAIAKKSTVAST